VLDLRAEIATVEEWEVWRKQNPQSLDLPAIRFPEPKPNPDAHLGAEEKPYAPLVQIRHYGSNAHSGGRISRGSME